MRVIEPGHVYGLAALDDGAVKKEVVLTFVNREAGTEHWGTQTQEVLRALIDRTEHCDRCLRWDGNDKIVYHLRMALALHESRAIERKTEKGLLRPELVTTGADGHFDLDAYRDEPDPDKRLRLAGLGKVIVEGHPRHVGPEPGHLSECLVVSYPSLHCTCDDDSPEWTT